MSRKPLPVHTPTRTPTTDAMRTKLGGRVGAAADDAIGRFAARPADDVEGWVLSGDETHWFLWDGGVAIRRTPKVDVTLQEDRSDALAPSLLRTWASLGERETVEFQAADTRWQTGLLVEKCRFGALVARDDGSIVAVGFLALRAVRSGLH